MRVIITGGTGFVGGNLGKYLQEKGYTISNLSLRDDKWKARYNTDAEVVIHLAGKAHDTKHTSTALEYFKINRDLTIDLFDKFITSRSKIFIYFSSVKAVADEVDNVLTEDVIPNAITAYGKSKLEAEDYLIKQDLPVDKKLFIIRPCMIHGPNNKGNLNLLYKVVEKGIPWPLASYENKRSFLSIDNLSYLINELILKENVPSGIYNFSDDEFVSSNELIIAIGEVLGRKAKLLRINKKLMECFAKAGDWFNLPLNSERLTKLTENYRVSNAKIKTALGIESLPLTAKEGLEITIKSFKK